MQDIQDVLTKVMKQEQCSSIRAFFLLMNEGDDKDGIRKLQSEPRKKASRRLRDTSHIKEHGK